MLLSLDSLMQTVGVSSSRHYTTCELVYDKYLIVLYNIVLISEHKVVGSQRKDNTMLYFKVFRICKVLYIEVFFYLFDTFFCKVYDLILFIYYKVTCLFDFVSHKSAHLCKLRTCLTSFKLLCKHITDLIELCRLA